VQNEWQLSVRGGKRKNRVHCQAFFKKEEIAYSNERGDADSGEEDRPEEKPRELQKGRKKERGDSKCQ